MVLLSRIFMSNALSSVVVYCPFVQVPAVHAKVVKDTQWSDSEMSCDQTCVLPKPPYLNYSC